MLTFFTVPKAFIGATAQLQRNALASWSSIDSGVEVLLFGDEDGVSDEANERVRHLPELASTELGTPRVDDLFVRAEAAATNERLCFVNADIVLPPSLVPALQRADSAFHTWIAVGQCREVELDEPITCWSDTLAARAAAAPLRGAGGIDYITFRKGAFGTLPPFALGRANFDNWLIWQARRRGLAVLDLTDVVPAIHQRHDYGHVEGGRRTAYFGAEARANLELAGSRLRLFNIDDSTHRLTATGIKRNLLAPVRANSLARWLALEAGRVERRLRGEAASV